MRINLALKLYFPILLISTIIGISAFNMINISSFVNEKLQMANNKEIQLEKDVEFITNSLVIMNKTLIENILNKKYKVQDLENNFIKIETVLNKMKKSPYFRTKERKEILVHLEARIHGYHAILIEMPNEFQESYEDGTYSILSLISINQKLNKELKKLQNETKKILNQQIFQIVKDKIEFQISIIIVILSTLFFMISLINKKILNSLSELKQLNNNFLLFMQKKINKIKKIDPKNIPNDEVGDTIKLISNNIKHVEQIIIEDRKLKSEIINTQREIVFTMGAIGESRSKETGNHVKRVAEYSYLLAKFYGLEEDEARLIKEASPMHDIGKVAIPDNILNKPGKLTKEEFEIMQTHAKLGYEMLKHSNRPILKAASIIAYEHHEKYNGKGYPLGLKEDEIHIYGAITAIADVFDALGSDRVYKKAWDDEKIINLIIEETGEHFHPVLANLFLAHFDKFVEIREKFKDLYIKDKELASA